MINKTEELIGQGRYLEAISILREADIGSDDVRQKQLFALCLSKSGSPDAALDFLLPVYENNPEDPETAGILGSIYKELFKKNQQTSFAARSRDTYLKNFNATRNYYTGVNAATMSAIMMQASRSREIAKEVMSLIPANTNDFWELCTLGECHLLSKDKQRSIQCYTSARKIAANDWGKIASAYNQLWLLNYFIPVSTEILRIFTPPVVVAFAGHMIDHPDRPDARFPESIESKIKDTISTNIRTINAHIGYSSLACGGDILFAEAMAEAGGEVNIMLPFKEEDFLRESVLFGGRKWMERYKKLKEKFPVRIITREPYDGHDELFANGSRIIFGEAVLRSKSFNNKPHLITVLSETDRKRKKGGTRDIIPSWPFPESHININPDLYHSMSDVTIDEETTTLAEANRPLLHMMKIDFSLLTIAEREKLKKEIYAIIGDSITPVHEFSGENQTMVYGFEGLFSAMDLTGQILQRMKTQPFGKTLKTTAVVGPVDLSSEPQRSDAFTLLEEISMLTSPGTVCASEYMAALFALEVNKFRIDYAGNFVSSRLNQNFSLHNIKSV